MTSNRTTLADLRTMDMQQVAALPIDHLALLADDVATLKADANPRATARRPSRSVPSARPSTMPMRDIASNAITSSRRRL